MPIPASYLSYLTGPRGHEWRERVDKEKDNFQAYACTATLGLFTCSIKKLIASTIRE